MKKIGFYVLLFVLSLSLVACGGGSKDDGSDSSGEISADSDVSSSEVDTGANSSETDTDLDSDTDSSETDTDTDSDSDSSSGGGEVEKPTVGAPILTEDGNILYGLYPQTRVSEESLLITLDTLSPSEINGWYLYEGEYYAKQTAAVYNDESYAFDDGTAIVNGAAYWFKCELIEWQILSEDDGGYCVLSTLILDAQAYYASYESRTLDGQTVYANNYAESDIREWLNGEFFQTAFAVNGAYVQEREIDNGGATTELLNNPYASASTLDKVFLPSYQDYYAFTDSAEKTAAREAKTTDYARAMGAWCHTRNNSDEDTRHNGAYWTRSPSCEYDYCVTVVNSGGVLSSYTVDEESNGVRPAMYIDK